LEPVNDIINTVAPKLPLILWILIVVVGISLLVSIILILFRVLSTGGKLKIDLKRKSISIEKQEAKIPSDKEDIFTDDLISDTSEKHTGHHACEEKDCVRMKAVEVLQLMEKLEEYLNEKWMIRLKLNLRDQMKVVEGKLRHLRGIYYSNFLTLLKNRLGDSKDITNCSESYAYARALDFVFDVIKTSVRERCSDDFFEKISDQETDSGFSDWHTYKQNAWEDLRAIFTQEMDAQYPHFIDIARKDVYDMNTRILEEHEVKSIILKTFNNLRDIAINYDKQLSDKKDAYQEEVKKVFK
jgi:hypothetical protein